MVAIVFSKCASMPSSCKGTYRNIYVVDVPYWLANDYLQGKWGPNSIRDKLITRHLRSYGPCSVGKTERASFQRHLKIAEDYALQINSAADMATAEQIIGAGGSA